MLCMLPVLRSRGGLLCRPHNLRAVFSMHARLPHMHAAYPPQLTGLLGSTSHPTPQLSVPYQAQVVPVSAGGTTASYRQWCVDAIAGDIKEFICR